VDWLTLWVVILVYLIPALFYLWVGVILWLVYRLIAYLLTRSREGQEGEIRTHEGVTMNTCVYGGDSGEQPRSQAPIQHHPAPLLEIETPTSALRSIQTVAASYGVTLTEQERRALYATKIAVQVEQAHTRLDQPEVSGGTGLAVR
jgi:hypothetical protein